MERQGGFSQKWPGMFQTSQGFEGYFFLHWSPFWGDMAQEDFAILMAAVLTNIGPLPKSQKPFYLDTDSNSTVQLHITCAVEWRLEGELAI